MNNSLQNHLRTTVPEMGQVEIDEIDIGVDKRGAHHIIPVQAKGHNDNLGIVQIEQDFVYNGAIALFEMELNNEKIEIASEKHYRLVSSDQLSADELSSYARRPID